MSILRRLVIGFLVLLGLFAVNLWVFFESDDEQNAAFRELEYSLRSQLLVQKLQNSLSDRRKEVRSFRLFAAAETGPSLEEDELERIVGRIESFTVDARRLRTFYDEAPPEAEAFIEVATELSEAWKSYFRSLTRRTPVAPREDTEESPDQESQDQESQDIEKSPESMDRLDAEAEALLTTLEATSSQRVDEATAAFEAVEAKTKTLMVSIFAITSLLALVVAIGLAAYLTRRIRRLERGAERIGEGDLGHRIELTSRDELGRLADSFNQMAEKLRLALAKEEEARLEAESHSRAKSAFLANMSHELKTPMNAIIGYTEMLMENTRDEQAKEDESERYLPDLKKIRSSSDHLLALINDVLDLSKIEAGKVTLYIEKIRIDELLQEVAATAEPLMKKNDNTFVLETDRDAMGSFFADHTKVRQTLFNLLSNAAKFTRRGSVTLLAERRPVAGTPSVETANDDGADDGADDGLDLGERILFHVRDTGIGMSDEQMSQIFEEFTQADASTTRKYGGTGLGLSISRRFCHLMGGELRVESEKGIGSTFTIELPERVQPAEA